MQFNKPNLEQLNTYLEEQKSSDGIRWWRLPNGTSCLRILPPWSAAGKVALEVLQHRIEYKEPGANYTKYNWTCVDKSFGKPCGICRGLDEIRSMGIKTDEWDPNTRVFYANALVVQDAGLGKSADALPPNTHVLITLPKTVYNWIISQITNPMIGDITDPLAGIDILVTRTGAGLDTRYTTTLSPNGRTPIPAEVLQTLELHDLDDIFSTGFTDEKLSGLVNYLKGAAFQLGAQMPSLHQQNQQVANPQPPQQTFQPTQFQPPQFQQPVQQPTQAQYQPIPDHPQSPPQQFQQPPQQFVQPNQQGINVPNSPYTHQPPQQFVQPPVNQTAPPPVAGRPNCFKQGAYDSSNVTCITCPHEMECQGN